MFGFTPYCQLQNSQSHPTIMASNRRSTTGLFLMHFRHPYRANPPLRILMSDRFGAVSSSYAAEPDTGH